MPLAPSEASLFLVLLYVEEGILCHLFIMTEPLSCRITEAIYDMFLLSFQTDLLAVRNRLQKKVAVQSDLS